uniref:Uncharacterized protein n=1 Tax=Naja naja TaxID=35670 RepID=A0A8C6XTR7_NAJNA
IIGSHRQMTMETVEPQDGSATDSVTENDSANLQSPIGQNQISTIAQVI